MKYVFFVLALLVVACSQAQQLPFQEKLVNSQEQTQTISQTPQEEITNKSTPTKTLPNNLPQLEQKMISSRRNIVHEWSGFSCQKTGAVTLSSPIDPDKIELIAPYGLMIDAHVTPIDHQYWSPKGQFMQAPPTSVMAPADGFVVSIQRMIQYVGDREQTTQVDDYRVILEHSCTFYTYFIHIGQLSEKIMREFKKQSNGALYSNVRVPVVLGEIIGRITKPVDFAVIDITKNLSGFVKPEHYDAEPWKIHTADPFDYFEEPLRSQLLAKNPRMSYPRGGKIDYDKEGYVIGNWFVKGTKGYGGLKQEEYWRGHLAFAPDTYDPNQFVVSIGNYEGKAKQFGIKEGPSPDTVTTNSGIVKYTLAQYDYLADGRPWSRWTYEGPLSATIEEKSVQATLLVQVIGKNTIKAEVFSKAPSEVTAFENPLEYER